MILAMEVTCPDSPRSIDLEDIRETILDALQCEIEGLEICFSICSDSGREFELTAEVSCLQILEPASARACGFYVDPETV